MGSVCITGDLSLKKIVVGVQSFSPFLRSSLWCEMFRSAAHSYNDVLLNTGRKAEKPTDPETEPPETSTYINLPLSQISPGFVLVISDHFDLNSRTKRS